jgi:hypothetical protein
MLRLIGICALLYLAYWAGANGFGVGDVVNHLQDLLNEVDTAAQ